MLIFQLILIFLFLTSFRSAMMPPAFFKFSDGKRPSNGATFLFSFTDVTFAFSSGRLKNEFSCPSVSLISNLGSVVKFQLLPSLHHCHCHSLHCVNQNLVLFVNNVKITQQGINIVKIEFFRVTSHRMNNITTKIEKQHT